MLCLGGLYLETCLNDEVDSPWSGSVAQLCALSIVALHGRLTAGRPYHSSYIRSHVLLEEL